MAGCVTGRTPVTDGHRIVPAPGLLPGVIRPMKTAGFWISRHPDPDRLVMDAGQIQAFNRRLQDQRRSTVDIGGFPEFADPASLRREIKKQYDDFNRGTFYFANGRVVAREFLERTGANMAWDAIGETPAVRFGFVVRYVDQRLLPTDEIVTAKPGDIDFDEVQNSALDTGTPVVIFHESRDGAWLYVRSDASAGWVARESVAFCRREDIRRWEEQQPFIVTVSAKADLYLDEERRRHAGYVQMGQRFPLMERIPAPAPDGTAGMVRVLVPTRGADGDLVLKDGYFNRTDVHEGYLLYTPRHIYE